MKQDKIKLFFFVWSLSLALLIGQMIKVPLGTESVQIIDLVIVLQFAWIICDVFAKTLTQTVKPALLFSVFFLMFWCVFSLLYGLLYVAAEKIQYGDLVKSLMGAARFIYPVVLSAYLLSMRMSYEGATMSLRILYVVACFVILFGVFQSFFIENFAIRFGPDYNWDIQGKRLVGIFLDPNLAASFCSAFVIFSMTLLYFNVLSKMLVVFGLYAAVIATFLTLSRGGIIGLFFALLVFMILYKKSIVKILRPSTLIGFIFLCTVIVVLIYKTYSLSFLIDANRFGFSNESALNRFANVSALFDLFFDYPFFGDMFYGFSGNYIDGGILFLLASLGVFGITVLALFLVIYLRQIQLPVRMWLPITVMFSIQSLATSTIFYPLIVCYFAAIISLMYVALKLRV